MYKCIVYTLCNVCVYYFSDFQAIYFDYSGLSEGGEVFTGLQLFLGTGRVADSWLFFKGLLFT